MNYKPFKEGTSSAGRPMHYTVGALIKRDGKYLLLDRAVPPPGFAGCAGHIDKVVPPLWVGTLQRALARCRKAKLYVDGENAEAAIRREVKEETNLEVTHAELLFEEELYFPDAPCVAGCATHYWYLYRCETKGNARPDEESKSLEWYTIEEIKKLPLEVAWIHWFKKLGIT